MDNLGEEPPAPPGASDQKRRQCSRDLGPAFAEHPDSKAGMGREIVRVRRRGLRRLAKVAGEEREESGGH